MFRVTLLILLLLPKYVFAYEIWYEDNMRSDGNQIIGVIPKDFISRFDDLGSFTNATAHINVYMFRSKVLGEMDDDFLKNKLNKYLQNNNIKIAIDTVGSVYWNLQKKDKIIDDELNLYRRLNNIGIEISYISLESVLSRAVKNNGEKTDYPLEKRIEDIVTFSKQAISILPNVKIGIIDALPSHGKEYKKPYLLLKKSLQQHNIKLAFIHLDVPYDYLKHKKNKLTWHKLIEIEQFVKNDINTEFGVIFSSKEGSQISSIKFHENILNELYCFSKKGGMADSYIITSWFKNPKLSVPDYPVNNEYPLMYTLLEFAKNAEKLYKNKSDELEDNILVTRICGY